MLPKKHKLHTTTKTKDPKTNKIKLLQSFREKISSNASDTVVLLRIAMQISDPTYQRHYRKLCKTIKSKIH
jgi:hypothetical protein